MCDSRWRRVIGAATAGNAGSHLRAGSSIDSLPSCASSRIAAAVNCLLTEASRWSLPGASGDLRLHVGAAVTAAHQRLAVLQHQQRGARLRAVVALHQRVDACIHRILRRRHRHVVQQARRRLGLEGEMPPLHRVVVEAGGGHRIDQQPAVGALRGAGAWPIGIGLFAEEIERRAHVQRRAVRAVRIATQQGQVHRGATAVAGDRGDVVAAQRRLVQPRVVGRLGAAVGGVVQPAHEVGDGARRAVAVENAQPQVLRAQFAFHARQRFGGFALEPAARRFVAIDRRADEVVAAEVADFLGDVGHLRAHVDHAGGVHGCRRRQHRLRRRGGTAGEQQQHRNRQQSTHQSQPPTRRNDRSS